MTRRINEPAVNPSEPTLDETAAKITRALEARLEFDKIGTGSAADAWIDAENALSTEEFAQYLATYRKTKTAAHLAAYQESKGSK